MSWVVGFTENPLSLQRSYSLKGPLTQRLNTLLRYETGLSIPRGFYIKINIIPGENLPLKVIEYKFSVSI